MEPALNQPWVASKDANLNDEGPNGEGEEYGGAVGPNAWLLDAGGMSLGAGMIIEGEGMRAIAANASASSRAPSRVVSCLTPAIVCRF